MDIGEESSHCLGVEHAIELLRSLERLGSGDKIAEYLRTKKMFGVPGDVMINPLAEYISREIDEAWVLVTKDLVVVGGLGIEPPPHVRQFIIGFEAYKYFYMLRFHPPLYTTLKYKPSTMLYIMNPGGIPGEAERTGSADPDTGAS